MTWLAPSPRPRKPIKAFALDLEAGSPLEFLDSSWARSYLPASWRSEEVCKTMAAREIDVHAL